MKHFYMAVLILLSISAARVSAQESSSAAPQIPDGEWTVIGDGEYYEDIFTMIHWQKGKHWTVTIEENDLNPGWYRFVAYGDACPDAIVSSILDAPDNESYMYINASDPDKAYVALSTFGNKYNVCSYVPENDFDAYRYLIIKDGVISAPDSGIAYQLVGAGERWQLGNFFQNFKLVMPESEWRDFRFSITSLEDKSCSEDNIFHFTISNVGPDIKRFTACAKLGYFNGTDDEIAYAVANGTEVSEGKNTITADAPGRYALIVTAYDEKDRPVASNSSFFYVLDDNNDDWTDYGTAVYFEDVLGSVYPDMTTERVNVPVQVHKNRPGYYRLVEPYKNHPYYSSGIYANMYRPHDAHLHCLYVNAEDPDAVYIEDTPAGVNNGLGDISIFSLAFKYLADGMTKDQVSELGLFGTLEGREITFPDQSLILVERFYKQAVFISVEAPMFRITLPKQAGIDDASVDDSSDAPILYYNLQGQPVDNPSAGLYLRRQGSRTEKILIP